MAITAKDVMKLREITGQGMMECKQALEEAQGDAQKARDVLRKKGLVTMDTRADRVSAAGAVAVALAPDRHAAAIVEVNTETDFTARSDAFTHMMTTVAAEALKQGPGVTQKSASIQATIDQVRLTTKENAQFARGQTLGGHGSKVGSYVHHNSQVGAIVELTGEGVSAVTDDLLKELCQHIVAAPITPISVDETGVPADLVEKEKQIAKAQAIEQGKPEAIAEKMVAGKIRKFYEDHCLTLQLFIKDDKKRIKELLPKGATIKAFARFKVGGA